MNLIDEINNRKYFGFMITTKNAIFFIIIILNRISSPGGYRPDAGDFNC